VVQFLYGASEKLHSDSECDFFWCFCICGGTRSVWRPFARSGSRLNPSGVSSTDLLMWTLLDKASSEQSLNRLIRKAPMSFLPQSTTSSNTPTFNGGLTPKSTNPRQHQYMLSYESQVP
jgi:hypothetical protein